MLKLPFWKKNPKIETNSKIQTGDKFVVLDIGTEVLKTLLCVIEESGIRVLDVARLRQQQNAMNKGVITNLNMVIENCRLSISQVLNSTVLTEEEFPKKIVVGVAGEYVQGLSLDINYERDEKADEPVSIKEEAGIIADSIEEAKQAGVRRLADMLGIITQDVEVLHCDVVGKFIGGVPVNSMVGLHGSTIKIKMFASFAPKTYINALRTLAENLNLEIIAVVSQPFAVAQAVSNKADSSSILIDVGGGTTDIAIVNGGMVEETHMFGIGGRDFTLEVARGFGLDYRHAEARKLKYSSGGLDQSVSRLIKPMIKNITDIWLEGVIAAFELTEELDILPSNIILCGGGVLLSDIKDALMSYSWLEDVKFQRVPKINIVTPKQIEGLFDYTGDMINAYDVTPVALGMYVYKYCR